MSGELTEGLAQGAAHPVCGGQCPIKARPPFFGGGVLSEGGFLLLALPSPASPAQGSEAPFSSGSTSSSEGRVPDRGQGSPEVSGDLGEGRGPPLVSALFPSFWFSGFL